MIEVQHLTKKYGPGFSDRNLRKMRHFYLLRPIRPISAKLDWSDYVENEARTVWSSSLQHYYPYGPSARRPDQYRCGLHADNVDMDRSSGCVKLRAGCEQIDNRLRARRLRGTR